MPNIFTPVINLYAVLVADFIGLAILLTILATKGWNLPGRRNESSIMLRMLILAVINCIVDAVVTWLDGRIGTGHEAVHVILILGNCYLYLFNVLVGISLVQMIVKHIASKTNRLHFLMFWILCGVETVMLVINLFYPIVFSIDPSNHYHRGELYNFFVIAGLILTFYGIGFYLVSKLKNPSLRYFPVFEFLLPILMGLVVQALIYGISLLPACFAVSLAGIVIALQNECIYIDKLTGIYNRFEMDKELIRLQKRHKDKIVAYMLDLNGFKSINDNYSHEEGDQALIAFAGILNEVFGSVGTVIRFAGDEFVVLMHKAKESDIGLYKQKTMDAVERYNESSGKPYKLSAAVGGKVFDFSSDDTQDLVVVIDTLMYKDKDDYYKDHKRER